MAAWDALWPDLRFAIRTVRCSSGFAAAVAITLALGIGANAAIFSLIDTYVLRSAPGVAEPDRLVEVHGTRHGRSLGAWTYPDYVDLRRAIQVFSGLLAYRPAVVDLGRGSETHRVRAALVSSNYFAVLGAGTVLGRTFLPEEERAGTQPAVVISHGLWQRLFGADRMLPGKTVTLNGQVFTVAGVAQPGFRGLYVSDGQDVWVPLAMHADVSPEVVAALDSRVFRWLRVVGRLEPRVSLAQGRTGTVTLARQVEQSGSGTDRDFAVNLEPVRESIDAYTGSLMAGVGLLFIIVCANLSNLFLAHAGARRKEIATRLALGSRPSRVIGHLLSESILLAVLGGAAGLLVAIPAAQALLTWSAVTVGEFQDPVKPHITWTLVVFVLAISIVSGIVLGIGPALWSVRVDLAANMKGGAGGRSRGSTRLGGLLVVFQLSLSFVLLSGGGRLVATLRNLQALAAVAAPEEVLLISVQPSHQRYSNARARVFYRQLRDRVAALPGVRSASLARDVSLGDRSFFTERVAAEPGEPTSQDSSIDAYYNVVAPGYLGTVGTPLVRGRDFTDQDVGGAPPVVIVNATLASRLWPGNDPLGRQLWIWGEGAPREVVGLTNDRPASDGPHPYLYKPLYAPYPWAESGVTLHVRTAGNPLALLPALRREVDSLDPNLPLFHARTMDREIGAARSFERLALAVVGASGVLALLLAAIGLYGLMSHLAALRTREMGIRVALGARPSDVLVLVAWHGMKLALGGVTIGLATTFMVNRVLIGMLYGVAATDTTMLALVSGLLVGTAFAASLLPALRAARADPVVTLRSE